MLTRVVASCAVALTSLAIPAAQADTAPSAVEIEAEALLDERPAGSDSLIVAKVTRNGKPRVHVVDGVDSTGEIESIITAADRLRGETIVEWDGIASITTTNDPRRPEQWGHDAVDAEMAWTTATGTGVVVAVVDSGVSSHPDLAANLLAGYDFVDFDSNAADEHGHGTHVAGIIAAVADNGVGIAGAAPDSRILPVRVLNAAGSGTWSAVANGITWAVDNGADVINLSLGGTSRSSVVTQAIDYARSRDVVVVASAGNDGDGGPASWPGAEPGVLGVAATTSSGDVAAFSTRGDYVDVAAPGQAILSTIMDGDYALMSGTSMAGPYVAALAALVRQSHPDWSEARIRDHIVATAVDLAPAGPDASSGSGLVSFSAAVPPTPWSAPAPADATAAISGLDITVAAEPLDRADVTGYQLLRDGVIVANATAPRFTDPGRATVDGTHTYEIRAMNKLGQTGASAQARITVATPAVPVIAASVDGTTVTLVVSSAGAVPATGWIVQRNGTTLTTTSDTSPVVVPNNAVGTHTFAARAVAETGVSALSSTVSVQVLPGAPTITARRAGLDTVVTAGAIPGATAYEFTRDGTVVANGAATVFTDTGRAQNAGTVVYGVRATASGVKSAQGVVSHAVTVPTRPTLGGSISGSDLRLTVDAPGASELLIYRDGVLNRTVPAATTVTISGGASTPANWTARAATETGVSAASSAITVTSPVSAPATLSVARSGNDVTLTAGRVSGATRYAFFRDDVLIGTVRSSRPRFIDANRSTISGTYVYSVRAVNSQGISSSATTATWTVIVPATPVVSGVANGQTVTLLISAPGATSLDIWRDGRLVATRPAATALVLVGQPYGTNTYTVRATTATGVSGASAAITLTAPVPVPRSLSVGRSGNNVVLKAGAVPGIRSYDFYRDGVLLGRVRSSRPEIADIGGATTAGARVYAVRSVDSNGLTSGTIATTWTVSVPATPTVTAEARGNIVTLAVSAPGATALDIVRNGSVVATVAAAPTVRLGAEPYGTHTYTVRAATATGVSASSAGARVEVRFQPWVSVAPSGSDLAIEALPISGARRWEFFRDGEPIGVGSRPRFHDRGRKLSPGTYEYGVVAVLRDGTRSQMGTATFTVTSPTAPVIVSHVVANRSYATLTLSGDFAPGDRIIVHARGRALSSHAASGSITLPRLRRGTYTITVQLETATGVSERSAPITVVTT